MQLGGGGGRAIHFGDRLTIGVEEPLNGAPAQIRPDLRESGSLALL